MSRNTPTLKRILREASELSTTPSKDYHAAPLETDLYEWHFTIRGPPSPSPFSEGIYHGRIILPPAYPLKPPSFRFLTPSGRFEVNREICLSISGFHEESWQPAWGIRTALVAIRSFMDEGAKGQVGGLEASAEVRRRLAGSSRSWKCAGCGVVNEEVMKEQERLFEEKGGEAHGRELEVVPEGLRLGYREDLGPAKDVDVPQKLDAGSGAGPITEKDRVPLNVSPPQPPAPAAAAQPVQPPQQARLPTQRDVPAWIDKAIFAILGLLLVLILRRLAS